MNSRGIDGDRVLIRSLDVAARLADEVASITDVDPRGILLETMLSRHVLNGDGREVWVRIDGRATVREITSAVAEASGHDVNQVAPAVAEFCARLVDLGLVEYAA
jgi:hypothetical protein